MRKNLPKSLNSQFSTLHSQLQKGFTMIELIIVMAMIGGLATIVIVNYPINQERARDARRRSEIKQYQTALESYANNHNGAYLVAPTPSIAQNLCATLGMSGCPSDPRNGDTACGWAGVYYCRYYYVSDAGGTNNAVYTFLESAPSNATEVFYACSRGVTRESASSPVWNNLCP